MIGGGGWPDNDDLSTFMGLPLSSGDQRATWAVTAARQAVEAVCGQPLTDTTHTARFTGTGPWFLPRFPVIEIVSATAAGVAVDISLWEVDGQMVHTTVVTWPGVPVAVTYRHGYLSLPVDVAVVAMRVASRIVRNPVARTSFATEGMTETFEPAQLTPDDRAMLAPYSTAGVA